MADVNEDTLVIEDDQNTDSDSDNPVQTEDVVTDTDVTAVEEDTTTQDDSGVTDDDDDDITQEKLDAMSDEEFVEFLNSGKINKKDTKEAKAVESDKVEEPKEVKSTKEQKETKSTETKAVKATEVKDTSTSDTIDYKAVYEALFKPFKANGKEITPRTVEDIISLMQMGANYTKKMQLLAPMKKAMESLNKAEIDEENLNFLIDVHKGDKEAIKKLLKQHNIDPIDLDLEATNYKPNQNIVSDSEVEFADTMRDIKNSLPKIQDIMNNQWDAKSRSQLLSDPTLLRALHEEIEMGRFDEVQSRLEQERMFGRYKGIPDIQAYIDIVTKMVTESNSKVEQKKEESVTNTDPRVLNKTKAAPVRTKPRNQGTTMTVKDLYSMSDDEFEKLAIRDLV